MAHATLHFTAGLVVGMALVTPPLRQAWEQKRQIASTTLRWLLTSWALGLWAIIPSLLRYSGIPEGFCSGWWMNLFLFHPLINHFGPHATIIGAAAFVACFMLQYTVILAGIKTVRKGR